MRIPILFVLPLIIFLIIKELQAYPNKEVDSFSGKTTISSKICDGFANRIFVDKSIGLAFDSMVFSKLIQRNARISSERTTDEATIRSRIEFDEALLEKSRKSCGSNDMRKIEDAMAYLSDAKKELQNKNFVVADYAEWKASGIYETIRSESYVLTLTISGINEWWFFSNRAFEIKIGTDPSVYKLFIIDTTSNQESSYVFNVRSRLTTTAVIEIPNDIVDLIDKAGNLNCRVYFSESVVPHAPSIFEISGGNLTLWKEVIHAQ